MPYRAVIFDLGGVVFDSPLHAIAAYERDLGVAPNAINRVVVATGHAGAWARLERGELRLDAFLPAFEADCAGAGIRLSAREMMERIAAVTVPRPIMLAAIERIRGRGLVVAALTNNWISNTSAPAAFLEQFDVVVESAVEGVRKPDPRIYRLVCERAGIEPAAAVFLDDIGANLKPARALGMTTIKVVDPGQALGELEAVLGFPVRDPTSAPR